MKSRWLALVLTVIAFISPTFAQTPAKSPEFTDKEKELRANAVTLLRETAADAEQLRLLDSRLSVKLKVAQLMATVDGTESVAMFRSVFDDFDNIFSFINAQIVNLNSLSNDSERPFDSLEEMSDEQRLRASFRYLMELRNQIALSVANVDGELALEFYDRTSAASSAGKAVETDFKMKLLVRLASKDPAKTARLIKKTLNEPILWSHVDLTYRIYKKDAEIGVGLMNDLIANLRISDENNDILEELLTNPYLTEKKAGKPPLVDDAGLRILADLMADRILSTGVETARYHWDRVGQTIERLSKQKAVQIRRKLNVPLNQTGTVPKVAAIPTESVSEMAKVPVRLPTPEPVPGDQTNPKPGTIADERSELLKIKDKAERLNRMLGLAVRVATKDRESALAILGEARSFVPDQPTKVSDYLALSKIAACYTDVDPEKSFLILEQMIPQLNRVADALMTFGEFIDLRERDIFEGELRFSASESSVLMSVETTVQPMAPMFAKLAAFDFSRLRSDADRFDRREFRILAKLMIARSVLGDEREPPEPGLPLTSGFEKK